MIFRKLLMLFISLILLGLLNCKSVPDTANANSLFPSNEFIRLDINEGRGNFFLFYLSDSNRMRYEQLFNSREQSASYTSISVDGKIFRLGDRHFPAVFEWLDGHPVLKFEYQDIIVTQVFSPVRTVNSTVNNGAMITYTIYNFRDHVSSVGLTVLIDTMLGEENKMTPFVVFGKSSGDEAKSITSETLIEGESGKYWVSKGSNAALIGSVADPLDREAKAPDFIHFANWKRLFDSAWRLNYSQGRSFSSDSAVMYIYEPAFIESGSVISYRIFLTTDDADWDIYIPPALELVVQEPELQEIVREHEPVIITTAPVIAEKPPEPAVNKFNLAAIEEEVLAAAIENNEHAEIQMLIRLQDILVQFLNGKMDLSAQDLSDIERAIERLMF